MVCLVIFPRSVEKRIKGYIMCLFQLDEELGSFNIILKDCLTFLNCHVGFYRAVLIV